MARHAFRQALWRVVVRDVADDERVITRYLRAQRCHVGLRDTGPLALQGVELEETVEGLAAAVKCAGIMLRRELGDLRLAGHPSVEECRLSQKPFHSWMPVGRGIERRREGSPLLRGQSDARAFRQNLARRPERTVEHELADRRMTLACSFLQHTLRLRRNADVELVGTLQGRRHRCFFQGSPSLCGQTAL